MGSLDALPRVLDQGKMHEHTDMNGLWKGKYTYDFTEAAVAFTAWFDDADGNLSGTTLEANTFVPGGPDELDAALSGMRVQLQLSLTKIYAPSTGILQPGLLYEGSANSAFTEASGTWHFPDQPNALAGRWYLSRIETATSQAVTRKIRGRVPILGMNDAEDPDVPF